jgi:hypothetical protein
MMQGGFRHTIRDTCVRHRRHRPTFLSRCPDAYRSLRRGSSVRYPAAFRELPTVAAAHQAVPTLRRLSIFLHP